MRVIEQILDLARWAPSGDNTQPWRFEIVDDLNVVVHGFDTRDHCVYDLDGHPSQISLGALLENMSIAASGHGLRMTVRRRLDVPETHPTFDVRFEHAPASEPDGLAPFIETRSVQRKPFLTRPLTRLEREALEEAVAPAFRLLWLEGAQRRVAAVLMFRFAHLRLTLPEAYAVHRDVIEWNTRYSADKVPDMALGIDPMTVKLMRFVMGNWSRVSFFNRFLAGTWVPRIEMDLIPGVRCAAHFAIVASQPPSSIDDYVAAGRAMQRFWLTATRLGLLMQPELTPLIFSRYIRDEVAFTTDRAKIAFASELAGRLGELLGMDTRSAVFMGRVGAGTPASARSTRLPLVALLTPAKGAAA